MKYQLILFFALLGGIQCRSIMFPDINEPDKKDRDEATRIERSIVEEKTSLPFLDLAKPLDSTNLFNSDQEFVEHRNREKHARSRFENIFPASPPFLEKSFIDEEVKIFRSCAEKIDDMLLEIQNALGYLRTYLDEWCRKHTTTIKTTSDLPFGWPMLM